MVYCIGDGNSDVCLAENFVGHSGYWRNKLGYRLKMLRLFIKDDNEVEPRRRSDIALYYDSWKSLCDDCIGFINKNTDVPIFLVIDVDRTLIFPKGLCDECFHDTGQVAFKLYSDNFRNYEGNDYCADDAYALAGEFFRPYVDRKCARFFKDEDAHVFSALLLASGLIPLREFQEKMEHDLGYWAALALSRCETGGWVRIFSEDRWECAAAYWKQAALREELFDIKERVSRMESCIVPDYRAQEEAAIKDLVKMGKKLLNGHIVELINAATKEGLALPVGYSDRPGISVGLYPTAGFRTCPRQVDEALINLPMRLIWEG